MQNRSTRCLPGALTRNAFIPHTVRRMTLLSVIMFAGSIAFPADLQESQYLAETNEAMMRMHQAMNAPSTGDIDADFVEMMVAHHQGAIDMARVQLRYGHNEQLRRIAQGIIVEQQQEITAMRHAIGESL
jgi:uncharacterized protein (DUF305 family)